MEQRRNCVGLWSDVGDWAKLVVAENGKRTIPSSREKLAHGLSDCLLSVLMLAHDHKIDLEDACINKLNEIEHHLTENQ